MTDDGNIALIKRAVQAVNAGTMAQEGPEIVAADFQRHDLAAALPDAAGPGGLSNFIDMVRTALPDFKMEPVDIISAGDRAVMRWVGSGSHQGEFLGVAPTGKRIEWNAISIYGIRDGKLSDSWQLIDVWGILKQMGAVRGPGD